MLGALTSITTECCLQYCKAPLYVGSDSCARHPLDSQRWILNRWPLSLGPVNRWLYSRCNPRRRNRQILCLLPPSKIETSTPDVRAMLMSLLHTMSPFGWSVSLDKHGFVACDTARHPLDSQPLESQTLP